MASSAAAAEPSPALRSFPGCEMPSPVETVQLTETVVVGAGHVFDGGNRRYNLSGGDQEEGQLPVFEVMDGGTVENVIIGPLAADGIHCLGSCTLDHVWWEDIGEDAATALGGVATVMSVNCGAAYNGEDKTFQFNGRGELHISNFFAADSGKLQGAGAGTTALPGRPAAPPRVGVGTPSVAIADRLRGAVCGPARRMVADRRETRFHLPNLNGKRGRGGRWWAS